MYQNGQWERAVCFIERRKNEKISYSIFLSLISHDSHVATSVELSCYELREINCVTSLNLQNQMCCKYATDAEVVYNKSWDVFCAYVLP